MQVAMLLTNHLSRAMDSLVLSETGASETLQDALSLLLGLARSQMGRAILSQPTCVSKLLLLLTDQRLEYVRNSSAFQLKTLFNSQLCLVKIGQQSKPA